jgi:hypothetical protein
MSISIDEEIEQNFDFFQRSLGTFLPQHEGQYAVLRSRAVIGFFSKLSDAERYGDIEFEDGVYSIQYVTSAPVDLGFFSYAFDDRPTA